FILSGPSGSGKTTILKNLLRDKRLRGKLVRSVSVTTRPKRSKEKEGRDYFFISRQEFQRKLKSKKLLECTEYLGYFYATPKDFIEKEVKKNKNIALCLDYKGVLQIKKHFPHATVTIFILPPSVKDLLKRIRKRCDKTKEAEIKQRLRLARSELLSANKYDYRVVNKNLPLATKKIKNIILKKIKR
ncbi:MAG: guanylate kinase, partial [Candidatus Omnitrophota bacterium]